MTQMLVRGKELVRISPKSNERIEYSKDGGISWIKRSITSYVGGFIDLVDNGKEIVATTGKGIYYTLDEGIVWRRRSYK